MADMGDAVQMQVMSIESQVTELESWCEHFRTDATAAEGWNAHLELLIDESLSKITPPYAEQAKVFGKFLRDLYAEGANFPNGVHTTKNAVRDTLRALFDANPNFFFYTLFTQRNNLQLLLQSGHITSKNIKNKFDAFAEFDPVTAILIAVRITNNNSWENFFGGTKKANDILKKKVDVNDWITSSIDKKITKLLQLLVHPKEGAETIRTLVNPGDHESCLAFYLAVIKYFRLVRPHLDEAQKIANDAVIKTVINGPAPLVLFLKQDFEYSHCSRKFPEGFLAALGIDEQVGKQLLRDLYENVLSQNVVDYDAIQDLFKSGLDLDIYAWLALGAQDPEFADQQFDKLANKFIGKYFANYKERDNDTEKKLNQRQIIFALKRLKKYLDRSELGELSALYEGFYGDGTFRALVKDKFYEAISHSLAKAQDNGWRVKFAGKDNGLRDKIFADEGDSALREILSSLNLLDSLRETIKNPELMREPIRNYLDGEDGAELDGRDISWSWLMAQDGFTLFEKLRLVYEFEAGEKYKEQLEKTTVPEDDSPETMAFHLWKGLRANNEDVLRIHFYQFLSSPGRLAEALRLVQAYFLVELDISGRRNRILNAYVKPLRELVSRDDEDYSSPRRVIEALYPLLKSTEVVAAMTDITGTDVKKNIHDIVGELGFDQQVRAGGGIELPQEVDTALRSDEPSPFTDFFEMRNNLDTLKAICHVETDSSASADITPKTPTEQAYDLLMGNPPREGYEAALDSIDGQILMKVDMAADVLIRFCKKRVLAKLVDGKLEEIFQKIMPDAFAVYFALLRAQEKGLQASEMPGRVLDILAARKAKANGDSSRPLVRAVTEGLDDKTFTKKLFILGPAVGINTPLGAVVAHHRNESGSGDTATRTELLEQYNELLSRSETIDWDDERKDASFVLTTILTGQLNVTENREIKLNGLAEEFLRLFLNNEPPEIIFASLINMHGQPSGYAPHVAFAFDALILACIQCYWVLNQWDRNEEFEAAKVQLASVAEQAGLQQYLNAEFNGITFDDVIRLNVDDMDPAAREALVGILEQASMQTLFPYAMRTELVCRKHPDDTEKLQALIDEPSSRKNRRIILGSILRTLGLSEVFFQLYANNKKRIGKAGPEEIALIAGRLLVMGNTEESITELQKLDNQKLIRRYLRWGINELFSQCAQLDNVENMPDVKASALAENFPHYYTKALIHALAQSWRGKSDEVKYTLADATIPDRPSEELISELKKYDELISELKKYDELGREQCFRFMLTACNVDMARALMDVPEFTDDVKRTIVEVALSSRQTVRYEATYDLVEPEFLFGVMFKKCRTLHSVINALEKGQAHLRERGISLTAGHLPVLNTDDLNELVISQESRKILGPYIEVLKAKYGLEHIYTEEERFASVLNDEIALTSDSVNFYDLIRNDNFTPIERATLIHRIAEEQDIPGYMRSLAEVVENPLPIEVWLALYNQFDLAELLKLEIDANVIVAAVDELAENGILDVTQTPFRVLFDAEVYEQTPLEDIVTLLLDLTNPAVAGVLCALKNVSQDELNEDIERFLRANNFYADIDTAAAIVIPARAFDNNRKQKTDIVDYPYVDQICNAREKLKPLKLSMPEPGQVDWPSQEDINSIQEVMGAGITIDTLKALRMVRQYEHEYPGCSDLLVFRLLAAMPERCATSPMEFLIDLKRNRVTIDLATQAFVLQQYLYNSHYSIELQDKVENLFSKSNGDFDTAGLFEALYLIKKPIPHEVKSDVLNLLKNYKEGFDVDGTIIKLAEKQPSFREKCDVYAAALSDDTLLGQVVNRHRKKARLGNTGSYKRIKENFLGLLEGDIKVPWPRASSETNTIQSNFLLQRIRRNEASLFANYREQRIEALADVFLKDILLMMYGDLKDLSEHDDLLEGKYRAECTGAMELAIDMAAELGIDVESLRNGAMSTAGPSGVADDNAGYAVAGVATAAGASGNDVEVASMPAVISDGSAASGDGEDPALDGRKDRVVLIS